MEDTNSNYVHTHVHTVYSFLDGACKIDDLINRAKELGMNAIACTDHNHLGAIPKFVKECRKAKIKPLLGCCLPEQIIYTINGPKEIKDIVIGDLVLTHNGRYKKVLKHWSRDFDGIMYGIDSANTNIVWLTDEHPVLIKHTTNNRDQKSNKRLWKDKMEWIRADNIKVGKRMKIKNGDIQKIIWEYCTVLPKHICKDISEINVLDYLDKNIYEEFNGYIKKKDCNYWEQVKNIVPAKIKISKELMRLFGYFMAEGSYYKQNNRLAGLNFTFNINEYVYHNEVICALKNIFKLKASECKRENKNTNDIGCYSTILAQLFYKLFGDGAKNKYMPTWFLQIDKELQMSFLDALANGDGKITKKDITIKLANKNLIYQVKALIVNLGFCSKISKVKDICNKKINYSWTIRFSFDKSIRRYYDEDDKYVYMPIRKVLTKQYIGKVYNFEVEDDNSYITDITLHNCEGYWTKDTNILSKSADERNKMAQEKAVGMNIVTEEEVAMLDNKKVKKDIKDEIKKRIKTVAYDATQYHVLFLAMNQNGWDNVVKLQSESANVCTYNGRFLCDNSLLNKFNEDVIMTSACIGSYPAEMINEGNIDEALKCVLNWHKIFGDRFYLEIQPLSIDKQWNVNTQYIQWAQEYGINLVTSNDVHWVNEEDHDDHDTLLCIGTGTFKFVEERMKYSPEFWLRSREEMEFYFRKQAEDMAANGFLMTIEKYMEIVSKAMDNTVTLAERCDSESIHLGSKEPLFTNIKIPNNFSPEQWLTMKAWMNLYKYLKKNPTLNRETYEKQLAYELNIINSKGFAPYLLTVQEYTQYSESIDKPVGPGRGSGCGSLVLFTIGITKNIDPLQYDLMFERFLTPERTACPDIDLDFADQLSVINHLEEMYGGECVCHVGTYGCLGVKSGLKDFARVLSVPFEKANEISKTIDEIINLPKLKFADLDNLKETNIESWKKFNDIEMENKELFRLARRYEGIPRQFGIHASGILVTPTPITDNFPLRKDAKTGVMVTLWDKDEVEEYNAIKYDILGLDSMGIIRDCLTIINESLSIQDLYDMVDVNDPKIYKLINSGNVDGVFQVESDLFKGLVKDIKPDNIEDIIAITSIARPGPLSAGMNKDYARRKNKEEDVSYPIRGCEDILDKTFGVIAYQEQLMNISKKIAGFSAGQADSLTRKVTAKKKKSMMSMLKRCHFYGKKNCKGPEGWEKDDNAPWYDEEAHYGGEIPGAISKGYTLEELESYWNCILGFCDYCFNKSHAAAYSYITIIMAYLKAYYPHEFMTALLSHAKMEDIPRYIANAEKMGIKVRVPDINRSGSKFTLDKSTGEILFGFGSVKGVGEASIDTIIENRPYNNIEDAIERLPKKVFNKRVGQALIKAGAFSFEDENRFSLLNKYWDIRKDKEEKLIEEDFCEQSIIEMEREVLGIPITFKPWWDKIEVGATVEEWFDIEDMRESFDRNNNLMGFGTFTANYCKIAGTIFSSIYCSNVGEFDKNRVVRVKLKCKKQENKKGVETMLVNKVLDYELRKNTLSERAILTANPF